MDQRASRVVDILTVVIDINDKAAISNESDHSRITTENDSTPNILGFEKI